MLIMRLRPVRIYTGKDFGVRKALHCAWLPRMDRSPHLRLSSHCSILWPKVRFVPYIYCAALTATQIRRQEHVLVHPCLLHDRRYQCQCNDWSRRCNCRDCIRRQPVQQDLVPVLLIGLRHRNIIDRGVLPQQGTLALRLSHIAHYLTA